MKRAFRTPLALPGILLLVASCVVDPSPTGVGDGGEVALGVQPALIPSAADGDALPIHRIRAVVARALDNVVVLDTRLDVDPSAETWELELDVPVRSATADIVVFVYLLNVGASNAEAVQFSGRSAPITVMSGEDFGEVDVDLVRGPIDNLAVTAVTIAEPPETLALGGEVTLTADVSTSGTANPVVFWTSLDPDLLTTAGAVATAVEVGDARVVASAGSHADTVSIEVIVPPVDSVVVTPDSTVIAVGATAAYSAAVLDADGAPLDDRPVIWSTDDPSVATVDDVGVVSGVAVGRTTVTATSEGVSDDAVVVVAELTAGHQWTNPDGGAWSDPSSWSRAEVPGPGDTVYVGLDGDYAIVLDVDATIAVLEMAVDGDAVLSLTDGTLTVSESALIGQGATLALAGGTLSGPADVSVEGVLDWTAGRMEGTGTTRIEAGATAAIAGGVLDGRRLENGGTLERSGANAFLGENGAIVANLEGALLRLSSGGTALGLGTGDPPLLDNAGSLFTTAPAAVTVEWPVANTGLIDVPLALTLAGPFDHEADGLLRGTGTLTLSGAVSFEGELHPGDSPGVLTVQGPVGSFVQGPASTFVFELDGLEPGTEHDQLVFDGAIELGGSLQILEETAFVPSDGDRFAVMTYAGRTGTFDEVTFPSAAGLTFDTVWAEGGDRDTLFVTVSADGDGSIELGERAEGTIASAGETDVLTFEATAGQIVTVLLGWPTAPSSGIPIAEFRPPSGGVEQVADGYQATEVTLGETGTYEIWIRANDGIGVGPYAFGLHGVSPATPGAQGRRAR